MRSSEVVFNEPFGHATIYGLGIEGHITQGQELFLDGAVEPFVDSIVFRGMGPREVVRDGKFLAEPLEMLLEFTAIVSLDILNLAIKQEVQARQEISSRG